MFEMEYEASIPNLFILPIEQKLPDIALSAAFSDSFCHLLYLFISYKGKNI